MLFMKNRILWFQFISYDREKRTLEEKCAALNFIIITTTTATPINLGRNGVCLPI